MAIDQTQLDGSGGLIKSVSVDGESTVLRAAKDLRELSDFIDEKSAGCNLNAKKAVMRNVFGLKVRSRYFS